MPVVLCGRNLDDTAQRQRGVDFDHQLLNRVVVDLLDDGSDALGRLRRVAPRLYDFQNVDRPNVPKREAADCRPDETLEPRLDLRTIRRGLRRQAFNDPAPREGLDPPFRGRALRV